MTAFPRVIPALIILFLLFACDTGQKTVLVLVPHGQQQSFEEPLTTLLRYCRENSIPADTTSSAAYVTEDSLRHYRALVFLGISPDTLDNRQQHDLERFVQAGAGIMVINANRDTVLNWPWFQALTHERVQGHDNPWKSRYNGGRAFFLQTEGTVDRETIGEGLDFAIAGSPDYDDATTPRVPEENRFVTEVLDTYMYEPMEMVIFEDGRVLYLERRGDIKLYDPTVKKTKTIATFDVSITGNYEDGMLGVALDPDYEKNHWIYINYSPAGNVPKQNVSRFEMIGDSIIRSSEKIILEIPTQRETCCHSGGHLEFGPNGDLYISAGDNTSSKESDGFSPIDERPGRAPFDAQKSSANTNDLRGKILRIHPEPDGSYTIPDGNLFPKDGSKGKPEIYVMGTRNAFRFTVDDHNGILYWGDVGPDGGVTTERGPQSYDEFNQARKPGNYGWPYFVADNKAYADFDFATNTSGPKFDPERPVNHSPNNTGAEILPPAQKPMIWYPYGVSKEFPSLGTGSRSAMCGPVYYYNDFKNAKTRFPKYFDGKLFIFEWARSWVKVVSFDENINLARIEPFLPGHQWYKPIDIKFGPDGSLYVLQYGANYFEHNPDSRLVKITYIEGNREPHADLLADKTVGAVPLTVTLSAKGSYDLDGEPVAFSWDPGISSAEKWNGNTITVTYDKPGIYHPAVTVTDGEGKQSTAQLEIRAGNEPPEVSIVIEKGNKSFYFDGSTLDYSVKVSDKEDGSLGGGIDPSSVFFSFDYLKEGKDLALLESNNDLAGDVNTLRGKMAISKSDCKTCHTLAGKSIGPSYLEVARRYKGQDVVATLARKVITGGNGNWGKNLMAAHPQHSEAEASEMVRYILALAEPVKKPLPLAGTVSMREHLKAGSRGLYVLRARYTDEGTPVTGTLAASSLATLRHPLVQAEEADMLDHVKMRHVGGTDMTLITNINNGSSIGLKNIDLTGIKRIRFKVASRVSGSLLEVHAGSPDGALLGKVDVPQVDDFKKFPKTVSIDLEDISRQQDLCFVFRNRDGKDKNIAIIDWIFFDNGTMKVPE